jgi:hypothetical protein
MEVSLMNTRIFIGKHYLVGIFYSTGIIPQEILQR